MRNGAEARRGDNSSGSDLFLESESRDCYIHKGQVDCEGQQGGAGLAG